MTLIDAFLKLESLKKSIEYNKSEACYYVSEENWDEDWDEFKKYNDLLKKDVDEYDSISNRLYEVLARVYVELEGRKFSLMSAMTIVGLAVVESISLSNMRGCRAVRGFGSDLPHPRLVQIALQDEERNKNNTSDSWTDGNTVFNTNGCMCATYDVKEPSSVYQFKEKLESLLWRAFATVEM